MLIFLEKTAAQRNAAYARKREGCGDVPGISSYVGNGCLEKRGVGIMDMLLN